MAKQRIVNTKFWDDSYVTGLTPLEKLVFLYLITNPLTNISGVYELPLKRAAFDVGIPGEEMRRIMGRLEKDGKIMVWNGWIAVVNFIKHQSLNPKIRKGIMEELRRAPREITDRLSIDYQSLCIAFDSLSHSNSNPNLNINSNSNALPLGKLSTAEEQQIRKAKKALEEKWSIRG